MYNHEPVHYKPGQWEMPCDVCGTCSDFEEGRLVPVSFCPQAQIRQVELDAYRDRVGPRPEWLDTPDAARWTPELADSAA
jgi:hypothetical protein